MNEDFPPVPLDTKKHNLGIVLRKMPSNKVVATVDRLTEAQAVQQRDMYVKEGYDVETYCMDHVVHNPMARDYKMHVGHREGPEYVEPKK